MASQIYNLSEVTTLNANDKFVLDDTYQKTHCCTLSTLADGISKISVNPIYLRSTSTYINAVYSSTTYIESGRYTRRYKATKDCIVYWYIEWDCNGNDGLEMQILNESGTVIATQMIMRNVELNDSIWMTRNGQVNLGKGMSIRFASLEHNLNTNSGNSLRYLVVS